MRRRAFPFLLAAGLTALVLIWPIVNLPPLSADGCCDKPNGVTETPLLHPLPIADGRCDFTRRGS